MRMWRIGVFQKRDRKLNFKLVKALFTQTVLPPVCDVIIEETIFESLIYGEFRYEPSPALYELTLRKNFIEYVRLTCEMDDLDKILGWPKGTALTFFPYMFNKPFTKSVQTLETVLDTKD